jgi:predicted NAD-dependent protein-ADP-ribosyltransferase YbiA (DUF1768 family)
LFISGCASAPKQNVGTDEWWKAYPAAEKADGEILPQEVTSGEVVLSRRNELGLLSNFSPTPFTYRGHRYASIEGFWQMMKYPEGKHDSRAKFPGVTWKYSRLQVAEMAGVNAKAAGKLGTRNMNKMDIAWVTFEGKRLTYRSDVPGKHYQLIENAMWAKVCQNENVRSVLMKTGSLILKPDHQEEAGVPSEWHDYTLWMKIRDELRKNPSHCYALC